MEEILSLVKRVAQSRATVLITGESGTGKELVARRPPPVRRPRRAAPSSRSTAPPCPRPCSRASCSAMNGAPSPMPDRTRGRVRDWPTAAPSSWTRSAKCPSGLQAKLLRVLQEMEFERVGGVRTIKVDVRVIAASNRDLKEEVEAGRFREDLFYRLNVVHLNLPPLRQRQEDIPLLAAHFIKKYVQENLRDKTRITPEALKVLTHYAWPGNVRELENVMERAVILCSNNVISPQDLPAETGPRPGGVQAGH